MRGGLRPGGGLNNKTRALQNLKRELQFVESATAGLVPRERDFEAWVKTMSALLSMRTIGLPYIAYANTSLEKARAFWTKPNQRVVINSLAELAIKAQQRRDERIAKRDEKKLIRHVNQTLAQVEKPEATPLVSIESTGNNFMDEVRAALAKVEKPNGLNPTQPS
jgi:hypothetical protein